jgi:hypothetical protein
MRRSLGRCLSGRCRFSRPWPFPADGAAGDLGATYTRTGTEVAFIISELPGERAEALFIAMAALVPTAGEQFTTDQGSG